MKSFKHYLQESTKHKHESVLSWNSSFGEQRDMSLTKTKLQEFFNPVTELNRHSPKKIQLIAHNDHPSLVPSNLSDEQKKIIHHYTVDGSAAMNNHLRNKLDTRNRKVEYHHVNGTDNVEHHIDQLSSAFTPENTNREHVLAFSGIPQHAANKLMNSEKGSKHTLAGFTSTSTDAGVADNFANNFAKRDMTKVRHVMAINVHPGAGLSVHGNSGHNNENEIILNHGAHIIYHGSHEEKHEDGTSIITHHVSALPSHTHYTDFDKIKQPKDKPEPATYNPDQHKKVSDEIDSIFNSHRPKPIQPKRTLFGAIKNKIHKILSKFRRK